MCWVYIIQSHIPHLCLNTIVYLPGSCPFMLTSTPHMHPPHIHCSRLRLVWSTLSLLYALDGIICVVQAAGFSGCCFPAFRVTGKSRQTLKQPIWSWLHCRSSAWGAFYIQLFIYGLQNFNSACWKYGCETGCLTLGEKHTLMVVDNGVLRKMIGPKRVEVKEGWRKYHFSSHPHHILLGLWQVAVGTSCWQCAQI
jgi:hypothetical protein